MGDFDHLFNPLAIGRLKIKNRIVFAPAVLRYANRDGTVSDQLVAYYSARASGGAGLVAIEAVYTTPPGFPGRLGLFDDKHIAGFRRLTDSIHKAGGKVFPELNPGKGRVTGADNVEAVTASGGVDPIAKKTTRAATIAEIERMISEFGEAARRTREAGFDGIQIHGIGGHLVSDFLSPLANMRTDSYGGDTAGRAKFAVELVKACKKKAGNDFPVMFRLMADERVEAGLSIEDAVLIAHILETNHVDALDIASGNANWSREWCIPPASAVAACNLPLAERIKRSVRIPVGVAGRINDPFLAERILAEGRVDFVSICRGLMADPDLPKKLLEGRPGAVRKCIACNECYDGLIARQSFNNPVSCTINAMIGRESERHPRPLRTKRVLVIGGGPGGMEAAVNAAGRGHNVTLWERKEKLGGLLNLAKVPPHKELLGELAKYYCEQISDSGVETCLGREADAKLVSDFAADSVIVATGSKPFIPTIPGASNPNVVSVLDVLGGRATPGQRTVILGGGLVACEVAEFLANAGRSVTVTSRRAEFATDMPGVTRELLIRRLRQNWVRMISGIAYREIAAQGLMVHDWRLDKDIMLEADTIVLATGFVPEDSLLKSLQGSVEELYSVGDCVKPRSIRSAIQEAASVALRI